MSLNAQTWEEELRTEVRGLLSKSKKVSIGCCIYDLTADSTLYEWNADRMMIPASTQKLYTATAMLSTYGEDFTFLTSITTNGEEAMDTLGNLFLKGDIYINTNCDQIGRAHV